MLKLYWLGLGSLLILAGLYVFSSRRKHLLMTLLSLEFISLSLYFVLYIFLLTKSSELYFLMVFLTFVVCEGALGLSILVSLIRTHGNDYFQSFSILQC
uniref:NADH-ubiquinone oxidoreductase chain 4L n=1 Tax=Serratella sp. Liaoning-2019 TaxID=2748057 RepID=A0A7D6JVM7_9INSE|nr:NADH dehydrogenase subunit 4L [Serratella sp. Liaoning-2019]QLP88978.1 NADH dehydrogenase subunit 4L [Serratella sp. Liaoning-2019]